MEGSTAQSPIRVASLPTQESEGGEEADIFATLFSPPTPRASPAHTPDPSVRPARHVRAESTDSDFGAFVSVSANEDPLRASDLPPLPPIHQHDFFDKFTEDARVAADRKRREVLDELFQHEDSLQSTSPSHHISPITNVSAFSEPLVDLTSSQHLFQDPPEPQQDHHTRSASQPQSSPGHSTRQDLLVDVDLPQDLHEQIAARSHQHHQPDHLRSPSLPPASPARPSEPEIQRTQSTYFTPPSIPSRWVSSLLSSTIRAPRAGTSPSTPPEEPSFSARFATFSRSTPHSRAPTVSESAPIDIDAAITHGTPFASQPYVPPSGAPGFSGDRTWDKGFEYNPAQVERKSVRLTGRKEMTTPVLTVDLADMIRPFLPALARLPKAWSLLYSLDQNGISLNTLYTNCQDFKGSALLIVRDATERLFGAWMGDGIHPSKGAYYGSGESFLWQAISIDRVRVFKWTGRNDYVALCEPDYLSFGGGDGHYGLWLDSALTDGSSARCPTFENEPLCSAGEPRQGETFKFECVGLEVWGIG